MIDTRKVQDRRRLRFETFDEALADAQQLADAEQRGTLRGTGNWALGQAIGHIAYWACAPFDGYPAMRRPPWFLRLLFPLLKPKFLNKGLPAGARIPGTDMGTFGVEPIETQQALANLRAAFSRLATQTPTLANPIFGTMSHDDWIKLNLRHAELHQSFFHPE